MSDSLCCFSLGLMQQHYPPSTSCMCLRKMRYDPSRPSCSSLVPKDFTYRSAKRSKTCWASSKRAFARGNRLHWITPTTLKHALKNSSSMTYDGTWQPSAHLNMFRVSQFGLGLEFSAADRSLLSLHTAPCAAPCLVVGSIACLEFKQGTEERLLQS